ncbi:putative Ribosome biogenesis protein bms1 [Blattamonas nauphoetae]|uniref:Ribosome biogenesis protein bms1 n=1 Tax=Blattamonas nauphoetae TaxID=2049346 RepID=A0ABQ9XWM9_9EUKA|nr:putative Ribosome biogenesis protein bms1 [Blattamonas nauphoetae]
MEQENKRHRGKRAGNLSSKVDKSDPKVSAKEKNPKAFGYASGNRFMKYARKSADREQRRLHMPKVDFSQPVHETPPLVIAVQGPPRVGKTTLIRSLIKHYTNRNVPHPVGPITLVAGKNRRITFLECGNDLNSMIDTAKIADVCLLLIDASFGFEMETFEFLNILQTHGFPKVMGVLTHLDAFKNNKTLKKTKKALKQRFWGEVQHGTKLFYLSGMMGNKYMKNEVRNMSRFISVMKTQPLSWQSSHPYVLVDRWEDLTDPAEVTLNPSVDRRIAFFGYLRGSILNPGSTAQMMHLCGVGDEDIEAVESVADPCPLPEKAKKRKLNEKETGLYAPRSDVGGLLYDKDAVYITLPDHTINYTPNPKLTATGENGDGITGDSMLPPAETEGVEMVRQLTRREAIGKLDQSAEDGGFRLFATSVVGDEDGESEEEDDEEEDEVEGDPNSEWSEDGGKEAEDDDDEDDSQNESGSGGEDDEDNFEEGDEEEEPQSSGIVGKPTLPSETRWMEQALHRAGQQYGFEQMSLSDLVYGAEDPTISNHADTLEEEDDTFSGGFLKPTKTPEMRAKNALDCSLPQLSLADLSIWEDQAVRELIRNQFVTGDWGVREALREKKLKQLKERVQGGEMTEAEMHAEMARLDRLADGEFQDEAGEDEDDEETDFDEEGKAIKKPKKEKKKEESTEGETKADDPEKGSMLVDKRKEKKRLRREEEISGFQRELNLEKEEQEKLNAEFFTMFGSQLGDNSIGLLPGHYVRIVLPSIPPEFTRVQNASLPIILGAVPIGETTLGFVKARFKKHRWNDKILKTNDPVVVSVGWRRYQCIPLYSIEDQNHRQRLLKYTPPHVHCTATFWAPYAPPQTGLIAFRHTQMEADNFRIAATGVVIESGKVFQIMKKLKLIGHPFDIKKNTAFIKDMFTSELEVNKYLGASIRTVSGIRGQIKKALTTTRYPLGSFRAGFEDKIQKSDIVFLPTWVSVDPIKFYNPLSTLLTNEPAMLKTIGTLKFEKRDELPPPKTDSGYQSDPVRKEFKFTPLKLSKSLREELPFKSKPKNEKSKRKRKATDELYYTPAFVSEDEKRRAIFLQQLATESNKRAKRKELQHKEHLKKKAEEEKKKETEKEQKLRKKIKERYQFEGSKKGKSIRTE